MKLHYFLTFAITSILSVGVTTGCVANSNPSTESNTSTNGAIAQNPCAGANPSASKSPCAGLNPCASKNYQANIYTKDGIAIHGTDPVAYFSQSKPVPGSSEYKYQWKGATWYFSSAENRELFAQNPEKYTPQYGGYCAYAMTKGEFASTDPKAWSIVDGKLYLNYSKKVQNLWEKDIPGHIAKANQNWSQIANK